MCDHVVVTVASVVILALGIGTGIVIDRSFMPSGCQHQALAHGTRAFGSGYSLGFKERLHQEDPR